MKTRYQEVNQVAVVVDSLSIGNVIQSKIIDVWIPK